MSDGYSINNDKDFVDFTQELFNDKIEVKESAINVPNVIKIKKISHRAHDAPHDCTNQGKFKLGHSKRK